MTQGAAEDFGGIGKTFAAGTAKDFSDLDKVLAVIEQDDPDRLLRESLHSRSDQVISVFRRLDRLLLERFMAEPSGEFERGDNLSGFCRADSFDVGKFLDGRSREAAEGLIST